MLNLIYILYRTSHIYVSYYIQCVMYMYDIIYNLYILALFATYIYMENYFIYDTCIWYIISYMVHVYGTYKCIIFYLISYTCIVLHIMYHIHV